MTQDDQDSFIRWQEITRNHFSSVANLILALATAWAISLTGLPVLPIILAYMFYVAAAFK